MEADLDAMCSSPRAASRVRRAGPRSREFFAAIPRPGLDRDHRLRLDRRGGGTAWASATIRRRPAAWFAGHRTGPRFLGDALADPLTGLAAAAGTLRALEQGGGLIVDAALARAAAGAAALCRLPRAA